MHARFVMLASLMAGVAACSSGSTAPSGSNGSGSNGNGGSSGSGPTTQVVSIADFSYTPTPLTVKVGTSVEWTNTGGVAHTVTADDGSFISGQLASPTGGGAYGGGSAGGSYSRVFGTVGTYTYHCSNHPTLMMGTVTVTP